MDRYICIHGHFYQPPRENPWLEAIEMQDSAYPFHDWNERINEECYAPNRASRILDRQGNIVKIVNNYARISFNFGPTLLAWLEEKRPEVYQAILAADQASRTRFSGHGSALAQAYNHVILPLANRRDKYTQILWGLRDFEHRFGRLPEGMWLPETAVDVETLEIMAELGIRFTVLAPSQARRERRQGGRNWRELRSGRLDTTRAYRQDLPSGRAIDLFFYNGQIAQAIAFGKLLQSGEDFVRDLLGAFTAEAAEPQLVHVATDGETYGHHHGWGDMALAYALDRIETGGVARLTNYGEFLARHPAQHEIKIFENTSWSCSHGIERWRGDCGCKGGHQQWNQAWRAPLRGALDWLRDSLAPAFAAQAGQYLQDPWAARDAYIEVILDRSPARVGGYLSRHARHTLDEAETIAVLKLLELQRQTQLMYTSCGWFFDEISGIEAVQVLHYAARALQLAREVLAADLEAPFLDRLQAARSNLPELQDGRRIYEKFVQPTRLDLLRVGAHYAVSSLFEEYTALTRLFCYRVDRLAYRRLNAGRSSLAWGKLRVTADITGETALMRFAVLHFGDHNLNGGIQAIRSPEEAVPLLEEAAGAFSRADFVETVRLLDRQFGTLPYSLKSLFRDEQRRLINLLLATTLAEAEAVYRQVYENHALLIRFLDDLAMPLPRALHTAAEFTLNSNLRQALRHDDLDRRRVFDLLAEARAGHIPLDTSGLSFAFQRTIERIMTRFLADPNDLTLLDKLEVALGLVVPLLPFEVSLWKVQNDFYALLQTVYPAQRRQAAAGDAACQSWLSLFRALGERLRVHVE